jgi:hypothetical protein
MAVTSLARNMMTTEQPKSILSRIVRGVARVVLLLFGLLILDHLPSFWNDLSPPPDLATIDDFREWKADGIRAEGTYEDSGKTYTVLLGETSAFLVSGPAAYVFDSNGSFVDWTGDMGDVYTKKHGFNLTSGNVKIKKTQKN